MFFTQEDFKQIEDYFKNKVIKDSDLDEALPLYGNEKIAIVQSNTNRQMRVKDLANQLGAFTSDLINVTNKFNPGGSLTLGESLKIIPSNCRKEGLIITFRNSEFNWEIWQFIGSEAQWFSEETWINIK